MAKDSIVKRYLEYNRAWAEALLIHEEKNFILLSERERRKLSLRAKGILPSDEDELFKEILTIPHFRPDNFFPSPTATLDGGCGGSASTFQERMELLNRYFGQHIAFAFIISLLACGEEGGIVDLGRLFHRIRRVIGDVKEPNLQNSSGGEGDKFREGFERRFRFLTALRDKMLRKRPKITEKPTSLKESLEIYLSPKASAGGLTSLSLSLIEGYILQSFGFDCSFQKVSKGMNIVVLLDNKPVYWEIDYPSPLSFVPIAAGKIISPLRVFLYFVLQERDVSSWRLKNLLFLYSNLTPKEPGDAEFAYEIGRLFFLLDNYLKAEEFALEALNLMSNFWQSYSLLGNIYTYREDFKKALAFYQKALLLKPDEPEINSHIGVVYMKMGEYEKARLAFKTALALSPDYPQALYNLGNLYLRKGDYKNSLSYLEKAARIDGKNPSILYTLANAYYKKGDLAKAEAAFKKVIRMDANCAAAWYNLGIVYRDKGEKDKAIEALEKAISLNPNFLR